MFTDALRPAWEEQNRYSFTQKYYLTNGTNIRWAEYGCIAHFSKFICKLFLY